MSSRRILVPSTGDPQRVRWERGMTIENSLYNFDITPPSNNKLYHENVRYWH